MPDAPRLKVYEQAREHWREGPAEVRMEGLATQEYVLRTLMLALLPVYLGMLGILGSIIGQYFTG